jgi:hypothetical protein
VAALTTQQLQGGGAITKVQAQVGGDTIEAGAYAGGWGSMTMLVATISTTATTITVDGVANGPYTSQDVILPVFKGYAGVRVPITYSQVTGVQVGAVRIGPPLSGVTVGT